MLHARRLYVYFVSAVALAVLAIGLVNLVELAMSQGWTALSGRTVIGVDSGAIRRQISLYTALVVVALPLWLIHWFLAERAARPESPESDRFSAIRALYLALVLLVTFQAVFRAGIDLSQAGFRRLFGVSEPFYVGDQSTLSLAILLVVGAIWAYHVFVRTRDASNGALSGAAVWLPRLYLYIAAFAGAVMILTSSMELLRLLNDLLFSSGDVLAGGRWWALPLAEALGAMLVGLLIWGVHWSYSLRLLHAEDWRGESERRAALRSAYLYLLILVGVGATLAGAFGSLTVLFEPVFGVTVTSDDPFLLRVLQPLLIVLPFVGAWAFHRWVAISEAAQFVDAPRQASVRRFYTYLVSLVGLVLTAVGLSYLLGLALDLLFNTTDFLDTGRDWAPRQASEFLAILIVGVAAWLWHWYAVQRRLADDPAAERAATIRRVYLYLVLASGLLAALVSLGVVLYELLQIALGVGSWATIAGDISRALAVAVIASAVLAYHLTILRHDLAQRAVPELPQEPEPVPEPVVEPVSTVAVMPVVLRGPAGADLDAVLAALRVHLPEGYDLAPDGASQTAPPIPPPATGVETASDTLVSTEEIDDAIPPEPDSSPPVQDDLDEAVAAPDEPDDEDVSGADSGDAEDDDGDDEPRRSRIYH